MQRVVVQQADFDAGAEIAQLRQASPAAGAVASFVGVVRSTPDVPIAAMRLEHYPGMTEHQIAAIAARAEQRFSLLACTIIHRFGRLAPGEQIVFAAAAAPHRQAALDAVGFLMDWLKTRAPFWKQEIGVDGSARWVDANPRDDEAAGKW